MQIKIFVFDIFNRKSNGKLVWMVDWPVPTTVVLVIEGQVTEVLVTGISNDTAEGPYVLIFMFLHL